MSPESLVTNRIIEDHMISTNLEPHTIDIDTDIEKTRVTQNQKQKAIEMMEKEVIECMEKAEKHNDTCISYVIKSNRLKTKSEDTKKEVELLEKEILDLEARKKKLSSVYP